MEVASKQKRYTFLAVLYLRMCMRQCATWTACRVTLVKNHERDNPWNRWTGNAMVEPLDGTLEGGLLLQTGLVGSIEGRFEVTIINPTSDEIWLRPRSPVGRIYAVDIIDRNPEHIVEFQELDDGLRVTMEPRKVTAFTRRISNPGYRPSGTGMDGKGKHWYYSVRLSASIRRVIEEPSTSIRSGWWWR